MRHLGGLSYEVNTQESERLGELARWITERRLGRKKRDWNWTPTRADEVEFFRCDYQGLLAEHVSRRFFGVSTETYARYERGGDGGVDFVTSRGSKVQVKSTPYQNAHLAILLDEVLVADYYIHCHVKNRVVTLKGYASRAEVEKARLGRLREGGKVNRLIHERDLTPFAAREVA